MSRGSHTPQHPTLPLRLWWVAEDATEIREAPTYRVEGEGSGWIFEGPSEDASGTIPMVRFTDEGEEYRDIDADAATSLVIAGPDGSSDRALLAAARALWATHR